MQLTHEQRNFFLNFFKYIIVNFAVFLLAIFALGSCVLQVPSEEKDIIRFSLTREGSQANLGSPLDYNIVYRLTVELGSDSPVKTADYNIVHQPTDALTINSQGPNFIEFMVNNVILQRVTITVTHKRDSAVTKTLVLSLKNTPALDFQQDLENATTVPDLTLANAITREVLEPLGVTAGTTLEKRYVTVSGGGSYNGTSWANAWAATSLRNNINAISDATANKVYLVMVAGGTYKPTYANPGNRGDSFGMKNHVVIMGGFQTGGGWARTGTTIFSGDIGAVGDTTDNSYHVFFHNNILLGNSHLYGVVITDGNANINSGDMASGGGMFNYRNTTAPGITRVVFSNNSAIIGGGMYNDVASPVLTEVVFSGNTATTTGGGMYNINSSSPVLTEVVFSGNTTTGSGGGMYNVGSSPVLTSVVFSGNSASGGGGMVNTSTASPLIMRAVFMSNSSVSGGGAMLNGDGSSPVMIGAVFKGNTAQNGGGMYNNNGSSRPGPLIVNTIFSDNSATGNGPDIVVDRGGSGNLAGTETVRIAGSVLGLGPPVSAQPTNAIVGYNGSDALNISNYSLANGAVNFGADATLTINGMSFPYPTITAGSSAINLGLFARKHVNAGTTTYYFSETGTGTSWHTGFTSAGGFDGTAMDLPTTGTIEDLTATDIAGNARSGRPDAGVYELP